MKISALILALPLVLTLAACDQKPASTADKVKDKVNDALDRRPNEKVKDAAEEIRDGAKAAAKDLKDAAKDATK